MVRVYKRQAKPLPLFKTNKRRRVFGRPAPVRVVAPRLAHKNGPQRGEEYVPRIPLLAPLTQITKMRKCGRFTMDPPAAGALVVHDFAANGVFDPDITGGAGSCSQLDAWSNLYRCYTVASSRITIHYGGVRSTGVVAAQNESIYAGITVQPFTLAGGITEMYHFAENCRGEVRTLDATGGIAGGGGYSGIGPHTKGNQIICHFNAKELFRLKSLYSAGSYAEDSPGNVSALTSANPTDPGLAHYYFAVASVDPSLDLGIHHFFYEIDYIVIMHGRRTIVDG